MSGGNDEALSQGGVYLAKLNPAKKNEIGKVRPVIVLTNQVILRTQPSIIFICPLSRHSYPELSSLHLEITARDNLNKPSYALIEHCRAISSLRLHSQRLAQLRYTELREIQHRLKLMLDINITHIRIPLTLT